jgi:hypothetical protein
MKLLLGLFAVVVARFSSALDGVHANSHREVRALWEAKGEILQSISTIRLFHTLASTPEVREQCRVSFEAFQTKATSCLAGVGTIFAENSTDDSNAVHSKIEAYCAAGACADQMSTAARAVKQDCVETGVFGEICSARPNATNCGSDALCAWSPGNCHVSQDFFSNLRWVLGMFCLQNTATATVPAKYCIPSFLDFVRNVPTDIQALNTQLTNGCDECTLKVFFVWSKIEPLRAAVHFIQLSNLCLRRDNKFCAVHQKELEAGQQIAGVECNNYTVDTNCNTAPHGCTWGGGKCGELWAAEKLNKVCHPCTLVYVHRALFAIKLMDDFQLPDPNGERRKTAFALLAMSYVVNGVCSTNLQDQYCLPKLQANPLVDTSCTGLRTFLSSTGCCAPSIVDFGRGLCRLDQMVHTASTCQADVDAIENRVSLCPGLTLGKTCAALKFLLIHEAIVTGIAAEWFAIAANQATLKEELKKVIAFAIGIDILLITEINIVARAAAGRRLLQTTSDIQVTTTLTVPQYGASRSAMEGLKGELNPLGVNDAVQMTTPGGSLSSPTITGQSVTNISVVENAASSVAPAFVLASVIGVLLQ